MVELWIGFWSKEYVTTEIAISDLTASCFNKYLFTTALQIVFPQNPWKIFLYVAYLMQVVKTTGS